MSKLLLTTVEGIPVIIKCEKVEDLHKFKKKNSIVMSEAVFNRNKDNWTQTIRSPDKVFVADLLNKHLSEHECWIRKEDAE